MASGPTRLCLFPPQAAIALSAARVRLLRRSYDGLGGFDEADPPAVARAISFRELPERTADLFHASIYLATDDGHDVIHKATRGRRDLAPWLLLSAVDLAIDVGRAAAVGDDAARAVLATVHARMGRAPPERVDHELVATRCEEPARLESIVECGRDVHGEGFLDGWVVACSDGVVRAVVVHGRRPRRFSCDVVRWDAPRGRVGLTLSRATMLRAWRERLAVGCAGDAGFFERREALKLVK
jgi:hypothetical protein